MSLKLANCRLRESPSLAEASSAGVITGSVELVVTDTSVATQDSLSDES